MGLAAAAVFFLFHNLMIRLRVDDPLDAVAVHAGGGLLGVLLTPFVTIDGVFYGVSAGSDTTATLHTIWANMVGALCIVAWSGVTAAAMFYGLRKANLLRVSREVEIAGMDIVKHGEPAYPEQVSRGRPGRGEGKYMTMRYFSFEMLNLDSSRLH